MKSACHRNLPIQTLLYVFAKMKNLILHNDDPLIVSLNRPQFLNALNREALEELSQIIQNSYRNNELSGIVITGEGDKAFAAGADIKEIQSLHPDETFDFALKGQKIFKLIEDCPKPVIAVINGFALGGGCELAMACHIRIAVEHAKMGQPEAKLGIIPGYGGTQRMAQLVGRGKALELILTGDQISAAEAKSIGLVNHVVATKAEAMTLAFELLKRMKGNAPKALESIIRSINAGYTFENKGYVTEAENFAYLTRTADFREGTAAFLEKRKPQFKGE